MGEIMNTTLVMTDPMELVGRLDGLARVGFGYDMSDVDKAILTEAAACIREMVEQRDAARSVIKDTCDKAAWMEGTASDSMIIETVAVLASQCRAYQHLASLPPAPGAEDE